MELEKIKQDICSKLLRITGKRISEEDVNLLGRPYYIEPRSLVYLYIEVQQDYKILINQRQLQNQRFATIEGISLIIKECLSKSFE